MSIEGPQESNEGSIEREKAKLEENLGELQGHLEELDSSEPSRKERIWEWIREHGSVMPLAGGILGGSIAGSVAWASGGTAEDFLSRAGFGALIGLVGAGMERVARSRKKSTQEDNQ